MAARVVLWDIDGTLLHGAGLGRAAIEGGVASVLGRDTEVPSVDMRGKTDPQIVAEMLRTVGTDERDVDALTERALRQSERLLAATAGRLALDGAVHPGVRKVIVALHEAGVIQTVLTGNLEANAAVKVTAFGLDAWLDLAVGAFGSDHHDRDALVPVALGRIARARDVQVSPETTWVVGDTPRDLSCARAGGTRCLLVATGTHGIGELQGLGADFVLEDLSDVDSVVATLIAGGYR
jgi:phosphoglycolate phosphatase-like HAD superfamily hydrolase